MGRSVGKIKPVPIREIFNREDEFTTYLQDHIDVLNDQLGFSLSNPEKGQSAGSLIVDLVAEDESGKLVVIENQLGISDHDHLGKLVTYSKAIDARAAIWIVAEAKPEHVGAISWLNESQRTVNFYLVNLELIRIGDSDPAPLLSLIVGPSEESRILGDDKRDWAERYDIRKKFWKELLERAKKKTKLHAQISPGIYGGIGTGAGKGGLWYNYSITKHEGKVDLSIDRGKDAAEENKLIFDQLLSHKDEIEKVFGDILDWDRVETRRACRISKKIAIGGYRDQDKWPEIQEAMIDAMIRLEKALKPHILKLKKADLYLFNNIK